VDDKLRAVGQKVGLAGLRDHAPAAGAIDAASIGIVGSKILYMDMKPQFMGGRIIPHHGILSRLITKNEKKIDQVRITSLIHGAAFLIKRSVLDRAGLFDEGYFLYGEEGDFCYRTRNAGFHIVYNPESKVKHHFRGTSGESDFGFFHRRKSALRFYLLNFSIIRLLIQYFLEVPQMLSALVKGKLSLYLQSFKSNIIDLKSIWRMRKGRRKRTFR